MRGGGSKSVQNCVMSFMDDPIRKVLNMFHHKVFVIWQRTIKSDPRRKYNDCHLVLLLLLLLLSLSVEKLLDTTDTPQWRNCRRAIGFCNIWRICVPTCTRTNRDEIRQRSSGHKFCKSIWGPVSSMLQSKKQFNVQQTAQNLIAYDSQHRGFFMYL